MTSAGPGAPDEPREHRSVGELTGDLAREVTSLVHHEMELARVELAGKSRRAGLGSGLLGLAAVAGLLALGCATALAVVALHLVLPLWLSLLIVAAALGSCAGVTAIVGGRELKDAAPPVPTEAIENTKENVAWIRRQAASARQ